MTLQEKSLYHQIHPLKLATDIGATFPSLCLLWQHQLVFGLVVTFVPSIIVSALVIRFARPAIRLMIILVQPVQAFSMLCTRISVRSEMASQMIRRLSMLPASRPQLQEVALFAFHTRLIATILRSRCRMRAPYGSWMAQAPSLTEQSLAARLG